MGKLKIGLDNRLRGQDLDKNLENIDKLPDPKVEEDEIEDDEELTEEEKEIKKSIDEELGEEDSEEDEDIEEEDEEEQPKPKKKAKKEVEEDDEEDDDGNKSLKKNYADATREAMNLHFKNEKLNETIEEAANLPEPTEAELKEYATSQGADWEELDVFSRNILKNALVNDRRFEKIRTAQQESKKMDAWAKKVDTFIEDSIDSGKYPSLATHDAEFRKYAMKEPMRGMELDVLVGSFLFGLDTETPNRPKRKSLLLPSTSGQGGTPVKKGLNETQVAFIRTHDPKRYRQLIKSGKINLEI